MFRPVGTTGKALLTALLVFGGMGYALAQENGSSTVDVIRVEPVGDTPNAQPASAGARLKAADAAVASAAASCDAQSQALQTAKREGDIIRATCLEDKLNQCRANLQNMKRRETALDEAVRQDDSGRASHESTVIGVLSQKFKMLAQAANQCVGQDLFDTGDTQTRSDVDLFAPDRDPGVIEPIPDWPVPYIPPPVSGVS